MTVDLKNPGGGKHEQRGMRVKHRLLQADGAEDEEVPHRHDGEFGNHDVEREHHIAKRPTAAVMRSIPSAMRAVVSRMNFGHTIMFYYSLNRE